MKSNRGSILSALGVGALLSILAQSTWSLDIPPVPMAVRINAKPNVLFVLDNSNSMDEAPNGSAAGSNSPTSKSEIARRVAGNLVTTYKGQINLGLMAYRQNEPSAWHIHNTPYDLSYDPAHYDPGWTGSRSAQGHKRFRTANPTSAGNHIHYNVGLPYYASSNQGTAFCYSSTACTDDTHDFKGTSGSGCATAENPSTGPWDTYACYRTKTGPSNAAPPANYATPFSNSILRPTDSDFAQGITDFGKRLAWTYVGRTWYRNDSPGRGYLHTPIKALDDGQAAAITAKLACNIPGNPAPCTRDGIRNAGLTPIEGTLLTARDYLQGGWSVATEGYTAACYPLPESCGLDFVVLLTDGMPSTNAAGALIVDPAAAINQSAAAADALTQNGVDTYVVGFALPYGVDAHALDTIAEKGGTGTAYSADNEASLQQALDAIFSDVLRKVGSAANLSANSERISSGTHIFQATFNSLGWTGDVLAYPVTATGLGNVTWRARDPGKIPAHGARKVYTRNDVTEAGVAFQRTSLSAAQQAELGADAGVQDDVINYIRGDSSKEVPAGPYRHREGPLGDIANSSPHYSAETNTLFVGANDGMLHAFDATTGVEQFAYIPALVIPNLDELTRPSYSHLFYVDGDIDVSTRAMAGGRNILVAALGRGGKGIFGLDVTTPATFAPPADVLWEYGGADADMGYVLGRPLLVKTNAGRLAVIVGNGINSASGRAVLVVLDALTGAKLAAIDTGVGGDNGLFAPAVVDSDGNQTADFVYAGDLKGNLWKFDISGASANAWKSAFEDAGTPKPFFVARNAANQLQAITATPTTAINTLAGDPNNGKRFVFFGTGRYLSSGDVTNSEVQSWYGIIDDGAAITDGRASLVQRTFSAVGSVAGKSVRVISAAVADDMVGKKGWFIDLPDAGERMVNRSVLLDLKEPILEATSIIPDGAACAAGGTGYVNAVSPFSGARSSGVVFDVNDDRRFSDDDTLNGAPVGSIRLDVGLPAEPLTLTPDPGSPVINLITGTTAEIQAVFKQGKGEPPTPHRTSWREILR